MSVKDVELKMISVVAEKLSVEESSVSAASRFQEDLGADSLDMVELLIQIEEEFGVSISDEESQDLKTIGDAAKLISERMASEK